MEYFRLNLFICVELGDGFSLMVLQGDTNFICSPFDMSTKLITLKQPESTDYESLLAKLANDITEAKTHLSEIRLRERRSSLLINAYGLAAWAVWAGLWWVRGLPFGLLGWNPDGYEWRAVGGGGVAIGPLG